MSEELRLSPSSINTYFRCPRLFYYNYILKKKTPPNIHLYKGTFVHGILDNVFSAPRYVDITQTAQTAINNWNPPSSFLRDEDPQVHKADALKMLTTFGNRFNEKLDMIISEGKARDKNHAWNLAKPKLREHKIYDKDLNVVGIIDSVETSYDNTVYLIDYKTSKLYRHTLPEEYVRQISIYAYLYRQEFGKLPNFVGIHYLRYGEIFMVPVTEQIVEKVVQDILEMRKKITSSNIEDYPRCNSEWCDCNYFEKKETIDINIGEENGSTSSGKEQE